MSKIIDFKKTSNTKPSLSKKIKKATSSHAMDAASYLFTPSTMISYQFLQSQMVLLADRVAILEDMYSDLMVAVNERLKRLED